jgi:hypothetical protein
MHISQSFRPSTLHYVHVCTLWTAPNQTCTSVRLFNLFNPFRVGTCISISLWQNMYRSCCLLVSGVEMLANQFNVALSMLILAKAAKWMERRHSVSSPLVYKIPHWILSKCNLVGTYGCQFCLTKVFFNQICFPVCILSYEKVSFSLKPETHKHFTVLGYNYENMMAYRQRMHQAIVHLHIFKATLYEINLGHQWMLTHVISL